MFDEGEWVNSEGRSFFSEDEIDRPTATDMRAGTAQVGEDVVVVATDFFQSIRKDSETSGVEFARRQDSVFVGGLGKVEDGRREPDGVDGDGAEGVANYLAE